MVNAILSQRRFHNEDAAFDYVEAHLWPRGPVCPHCKATSEKVGAINARTKPSKKHPEGLRRHGLRKCYACRKEFTVRVGTIFEDSHLPLHLWLQAIHLLTSGKKGVSTRHIQRLLNCSMKTAWFLTHRIREIMKPGAVDDVPPMGGLATTLEADEVYIGAMARRKKGPSAGREAYRRGAGRAQRTGPSTSARRTCTAISTSLTIATTIARRWARMTAPALR
jgi:transposase-like protein